MDAEKIDFPKGFYLWQLSFLWEKQMKVLLKKFQLSFPQYIILKGIFTLSTEKKEVGNKIETEANNINQILLSEYSGFEPMNVSKILCKLEETNRIKRKQNLKDLRSNQLIITDKGKEELKIIEEKISILDQNLFKSLSRIRKKEFKHLLSLLLKNNF